MSRMLFPLFYRQFGIRRLSNLIRPPLLTVDALPRNAMLHFSAGSSDTHDPSADLEYLKGYSKKIGIYYPPELIEPDGNPARNSKQIQVLTKPFLKANQKHFRRVVSQEFIEKDPLSLTIVNYSYLDMLYRYPPSPMAEYSRWRNLQLTLWKSIVEQTQKSDRQHFIFMDIPKELPSRSFLTIFAKKTSRQMTRIFNTPEKLFLLEFWKWLDPDTRGFSVLRDLSGEAVARINIVFNARPDRQAVLNLGHMLSWIRGEENFTEMKNTQQLAVNQIQILVLKFFMTLEQAAREDEIVEDVSQNDTTAALKADGVDADPNEVDTGEDEEDKAPGHSVAGGKKDDPSTMKVKAEDQLGDGDFEQIDLDKDLRELEEELKLMDRISERKLARVGVKIKNGDIPDESSDIVEATDAPPEVPIEEIEKVALGLRSPEDILKDKIENQLDIGTFTGAEYRKLLEESKRIDNMTDPFGSKQTFRQAAEIKPEDLVIDKEAMQIHAGDQVEDKSMLESSLLVYDTKYINKVLKKDILRTIASFQRAGVIIRKVEMETHTDVLGSYINLSLELKPIDGKPSNLHVRLPVVNEDGTFLSSGNKYLMRKQIVDLPFRVIGPTEVALSSAYGKNFISRNEKKAKNAVEWIDRQITKAVNAGSPVIKRTAPARVYDNRYLAPYIYNSMASKYSYIQTKDLYLSFDHRDQEKYAKPEQIALLEKNGARLVGYTNEKKFITVDEQNQFWKHEGSQAISIGSIYDLLELDQTSAPVDFIDMKVFRAHVPVALYLSYQIGFDNLLKLLRAPYRFVEPRKQKDLKPYEYAITFKDGSLIFDRRDQRNSLILGGLLEFEKELKRYEREDMNSRDIYLNLIEGKGMSSSHLREMDNIRDMFLDQITIDVLGDMKYPQTVNGLLIKAAEVLVKYNAPDETDVSQMRIRGYERLSQFMYMEISNSIRQFRGSNFGGRSKINMSPWAVWRTLMEDQTIKIAEDINPLQNVKEVESLTFAGTGGRSKDSMPKATREYHPSMAGFISEATVDSSDVGINIFLSGNPALQDMRGMIKAEKPKTSASFYSISALCAPGSWKDDAKRVGMVSIQQAHTVFTDGYHAPQVRTGGEAVIAHRTSDMFCLSAKLDGVVKEVTEEGITVQYSDGTIKGIPLGRRYGKAEGSVYPHHIVTDMKVGQKFKKGDIISFNDRFFERDHFSGGGVVMKNSMSLRVALIDGKDAYEDSCAVAQHVSGQLNTQITKERSFIVDFAQSLHEVVRTGSKIGPKDLLMLIQDEISSGAGSFSEGAMNTLRDMSSQKARSKYLGVVERIEVKYHGDKADMSESLRALADRSDRMLSSESRALGNPAVNGFVTDDYRVDGTPLGLDKAEVKFFITVDVSTGTGDKLVFANQMKCTIGRIIETPIHTQSGLPVDVIFGFRGFGNRVVTSPIRIGTSITTLNLIAEKAVQLYEGTP